MAMSTRCTTDHGHLPVLSLVCNDADLFSGAHGLLVPGETMIDPPVAQAEAYSADPVFWKYPGNFHQRGKKWERRAALQLLGPDGAARWTRTAAIRINGQQTRGLAQHAIRVAFDEPLSDTLFGPGSENLEAMVIRAAGNDQIKAMMRDAYQHGLCQRLPFDTAPALPVVLYINGAYWGVHHLRPRMDHRELARRTGAKAKNITVVEDNGVLYKGAVDGAASLKGLVDMAERADPADSAWVRVLGQGLDVQEFYVYMAAQMIMGNMDWPHQNIRFWRHESGGPGRLDGRWRMAMGDSDLGFGAQAGPGDDLFRRVRPRTALASRLLMALLRSEVERERFAAAVLGLLDGDLSQAACLRELDRMHALLAPEMTRHCDRWRKPATMAAWEQEAALMRTYALEREGHARAQIARFITSKGA
jgi:hypothetical protein